MPKLLVVALLAIAIVVAAGLALVEIVRRLRPSSPARRRL
jgi:hypothetical protein